MASQAVSTVGGHGKRSADDDAPGGSSKKRSASPGDSGNLDNSQPIAETSKERVEATATDVNLEMSKLWNALRKIKGEPRWKMEQDHRGIWDVELLIKSRYVIDSGTRMVQRHKNLYQAQVDCCKLYLKWWDTIEAHFSDGLAQKDVLIPIGPATGAGADYDAIKDQDAETDWERVRRLTWKSRPQCLYVYYNFVMNFNNNNHPKWTIDTEPNGTILVTMKAYYIAPGAFAHLGVFQSTPGENYLRTAVLQVLEKFAKAIENESALKWDSSEQRLVIKRTNTVGVWHGQSDDANTNWKGILDEISEIQGREWERGYQGLLDTYLAILEGDISKVQWSCSITADQDGPNGKHSLYKALFLRVKACGYRFDSCPDVFESQRSKALDETYFDAVRKFVNWIKENPPVWHKGNKAGRTRYWTYGTGGTSTALVATAADTHNSVSDGQALPSERIPQQQQEAQALIPSGNQAKTYSMWYFAAAANQVCLSEHDKDTIQQFPGYKWLEFFEEEKSHPGSIGAALNHHQDVYLQGFSFPYKTWESKCLFMLGRMFLVQNQEMADEDVSAEIAAIQAEFAVEMQELHSFFSQEAEKSVKSIASIRAAATEKVKFEQATISTIKKGLNIQAEFKKRSMEMDKKLVTKLGEQIDQSSDILLSSILPSTSSTPVVMPTSFSASNQTPPQSSFNTNFAPSVLSISSPSPSQPLFNPSFAPTVPSTSNPAPLQSSFNPNFAPSVSSTFSPDYQPSFPQSFAPPASSTPNQDSSQYQSPSSGQSKHRASSSKPNCFAKYKK